MTRLEPRGEFLAELIRGVREGAGQADDDVEVILELDAARREVEVTASGSYARTLACAQTRECRVSRL